ncbi:MAG: alanine--glyoxylate aminotransferase family protein [marine benthic group bacterium]|nr:alanine--glyoxylate aminotransferase family protein [Gemmatimonadota bacterium]
MSPSHDFGRFFLPGPTEVHPEVLAAMQRPVIGHRGPEMRELLERLEPGLQELFGTERPVYLSTSSATGLMETAIMNLSATRVLALVCGAFGDRFRAIAERCGRPVDVIRADPGEPNTARRLELALADNPGRWDLVTVVHSETSTGVLNPVAEIAEAVRRYDDVLLAVDGVTSVGGTPIRFDDWDVDFLLTGSQKAIALPPGLAFGVASDRALQRATQIPARSFYFDLLAFDRRAREYQTTNTPAVSLFYALDRQLHRIATEGLGSRFDRHASMAARTVEWVDELRANLGSEFGILALPGFRSPTVTAVTLPESISGTRVVASVKSRGFTIAPGYGELKDRCIRIGHMGDHTIEELEVLLAVIGEVIGELASGDVVSMEEGALR